MDEIVCSVSLGMVSKLAMSVLMVEEKYELNTLVTSFGSSSCRLTCVMCKRVLDLLQIVWAADVWPNAGRGLVAELRFVPDHNAGVRM